MTTRKPPPGCFAPNRSRRRAKADGLIRIVDIDGLDRQACGGTHLVSTAHARRVRILKVDNKGRQNRRFRIGLESD
ncbi:putative alanyl-tRNA synthetase related protein [Bradyrhizobium oligotrophicum S58]|uniref:Putative alanyl-tRNA synthetase related protein n=1 Tax=Bradyrhizobium oligotrophicum S58 TaxID=1245469 RepID=M4Z4W0_9BRAD|nr:putative alanyl-tRNA synthetase related protein [Bradyrhizobium oligotrophicum S58]